MPFGFIKTWWPAFVVLGAILAIWSYGKWEAHKAVQSEKKDSKIEKLEGENKTKDEVIKIRNKQNEIRNNRPDTDALIDSLQRGSF